MKKLFILNKIFVLGLIFSSQAFCYSEDEVKAAFIYNFTKFVSWPEEKGNNILLCLYGSQRNSAPYMTLANKGNIKVLAVQNLNSAGNCHILYKSRGGSNETLSTYAVQHNILFIGDGSGFIDDDGMIGLVLDSGKINFEVNYSKIKAAHLKVSSKLLGLAKRIRSN